MIATAVLVLVLVLVIGLAGTWLLRTAAIAERKALREEADAERMCAEHARPLTNSIMAYSDGRATRHV